MFIRERRFYFIMACVMAFILVAGFSTSLAFHRSSFAVPIIYHIHAFTFFGWIVLYLAQTWLGSTGSVALHKRLGWLALVWLPAMVILGITVTTYVIRTDGGPFFFAQNEFLFGNWFGILTFAGLVAWAITLRRRTDWHSRLMLVAMAAITGPGWGRLLPMPFIPQPFVISSLLFPAIFVGVGMIADRRRSGRVHPAYLYGIAIMAGSMGLTEAIAYSPVGYSVTRTIVAGTPGAERPINAYHRAYHHAA